MLCHHHHYFNSISVITSLFIIQISIYKYGKILESFETSNFLKSLTIKVDASQLADIAHQVQNFLEVCCNHFHRQSKLRTYLYIFKQIQKHFGKDSAKPRAITKFPITAFQDFELDGALTVILKECLLFQSKLGKSTFDILSSQIQSQTLESFITTTLKTIHAKLLSVSLKFSL